MKTKDTIKNEIIDKFRKMNQASPLKEGQTHPPNWLQLEYFLTLETQEEKMSLNTAIEELIAEGTLKKVPLAVPSDLKLTPDFDLVITQQGKAAL